VRHLLLGTTAGLLAGSVLAATTSYASTVSPVRVSTATPTSSSLPIAMKIPMTITGAGRITTNRSALGRVSPENYVNGDCGDAYLFINPDGGGYANVTDGFDVSFVADWYTAWTDAVGQVTNTTNNSGWLGFAGSGSQSYSNDINVFLGAGSAVVDGELTAENLITGEVCSSDPLFSSTVLY